MTNPARDRLRAICLALPAASETITWGEPTWRVQDRIFAKEASGGGRMSVWLKAPPGAQEVLVAADPHLFFIPPYVGHKGWIGLRLDSDPDWTTVAHRVTESYRLVAPKRLAAGLRPRETAQ